MSQFDVFIRLIRDMLFKRSYLTQEAFKIFVFIVLILEYFGFLIIRK